MSENARLFSVMERVYAAALLDEAEKAGVVDVIREHGRAVLDLLRENPAFVDLMQSRSLGIDRRAQVLDRVFKGKVHDLLYRFLRVLNDRDRFDELPGIGRALLHLWEERHGIVEAEATTATPMDDATRDRIAAKLGEALKRQVVLSQTLDESMIGGLKLRVGDDVIDGSLATQLRVMRNRLIEASRERARANFGQFVKE